MPTDLKNARRRKVSLTDAFSVDRLPPHSTDNGRTRQLANLKRGTLASTVAYAVRDTLRRSARLKAQAKRFAVPREESR